MLMFLQVFSSALLAFFGRGPQSVYLCCQCISCLCLYMHLQQTRHTRHMPFPASYLSMLCRYLYLSRGANMPFSVVMKDHQYFHSGHFPTSTMSFALIRISIDHYFGRPSHLLLILLLFLSWKYSTRQRVTG